MKKIGILLLAVLLCGCQMQNNDTEPKGYEPIEETTETSMQGIIVEKNEQKLVLLRDDHVLIHLVKEDLDIRSLAIGDMLSLTINRKISEYDRTFYGKDVTTLEKDADQADAALSYERYFIDEPPFQTVVTREGVADEYVEIELYSIRDRKQAAIPVTQTLNGTGELILEFDLNAGEFLEGDYYLLATFYDSEQKKENHGTAVTKISMYEEYLYDGIFSISEIGDGYIQVSSISGADDPMGSPNYFNVDLSGMINEET